MGPGSGSIGFGTQFYAKLTYWELRSSRDRLIQTDAELRVVKREILQELLRAPNGEEHIDYSCAHGDSTEL